MKYNYTAYYKTEEERINAIVEDILTEYPNLGKTAIEAAKLEQPFGNVHDDYSLFSDYENQINRLIDIVIVTEGKPEFQAEYKKACEDLETSYYNWRRNYTYANPEDQSVYMVMQRFNAHNKNKEVQLITVNQADEEQIRIREEKRMKEAANSLRNEFPELGPMADEVIKLQVESGIHLRWVENDLVRLVTIIKLAESRPGCEDIYIKALEKLNTDYHTWLQYEGSGKPSPEGEIVIEMMDRLYKHMQDKNVPISTYAEINNEKLSKKLAEQNQTR